MVLVVLACVVWGSFSADSNAHAVIEDQPTSERLHRRLYQTEEQRREDELMGYTPYEPFHLWFDKVGGMYVSYYDRQSRCTFEEVRTTATEATYKAVSNEGASWTAWMRMPRQPDYQNPCGVWALYIREANGSFKTGNWMLLDEDGTGYCGWDSLNGVTASEQTLRQKGTPCTWHVTSVQGGYLVVLDYEEGQSVVIVTA